MSSELHWRLIYINLMTYYLFIVTGQVYWSTFSVSTGWVECIPYMKFWATPENASTIDSLHFMTPNIYDQFAITCRCWLRSAKEPEFSRLSIAHNGFFHGFCNLGQCLSSFWPKFYELSGQIPAKINLKVEKLFCHKQELNFIQIFWPNTAVFVRGLICQLLLKSHDPWDSTEVWNWEHGHTCVKVVCSFPVLGSCRCQYWMSIEGNVWPSSTKLANYKNILNS
jgi:hypothetical protein